MLSEINFSIPKAVQQAAFEAVKGEFTQMNEAMMNAKTLQDCFHAWGFQTAEGEDQSLTVTGYTGDELGLEFFFLVLAPYVKEGSKLLFKDEGEPDFVVTFSDHDVSIDIG